MSACATTTVVSTFGLTNTNSTAKFAFNAPGYLNNSIIFLNATITGTNASIFYNTSIFYNIKVNGTFYDTNNEKVFLMVTGSQITSYNCISINISTFMNDSTSMLYILQ